MHTGTLIAIPLIVLSTGFFVAAEFAAVRIRSTQLESLLETDPRAALALEVHKHLDRHLSSIQVAITLLTISLGAAGESLFIKGFHAIFGFLPWPKVGVLLSTGMGLLSITLIQVVMAELLPRSAAIRSSLAWALGTARPLLLWSQAIYPVTQVLLGLTHLMERLVGIHRDGPRSDERTPSEDEIKRMLAKSQASGKLELSRKDLIENVFDFSKRTVKEVAVPRAQVVYLDLKRTLAENLQVARSSPHTRLPVANGDLDHVKGVIHLKEMLWALHDNPALDLHKLMRPVFLVPEMRLIQDLLLDFQKEKQHLALVVNEHGGVDGLVTLEDVLEELVGEIQDEFDREERLNLRKTRTGAWLAHGTVTLEQLADHLGLHLEVEAGSVSLGGFFQERLGRVLRTGDELRIHGWRIRVLEMRGMAPWKFLFKPLPPEEDPERSLADED
jgi:CBS domain containing-hemolysin-like protein